VDLGKPEDKAGDGDDCLVVLGEFAVLTSTTLIVETLPSMVKR
jgi:hypothetical protein